MKASLRPATIGKYYFYTAVPNHILLLKVTKIDCNYIIFECINYDGLPDKWSVPIDNPDQFPPIDNIQEAAIDEIILWKLEH